MDALQRKAYDRMQTHPVIQQALRDEPRLLPILEEARYTKNGPGYNRERTYEHFKKRLFPLVGDGTRNRKVATSDHWDLVVGVMMDLLPPDDLDLEIKETHDEMKEKVPAEDLERERERINRIYREEARKSSEILAAMRAKYMPKSTESEKNQ